MDKIIEFSVKNKLIVGLFIAILIGWGSYSLKNLPLDAVPDITNNQVQIITNAPTLAAQEVERYISYPIETAIANIPNIEEHRSISRFGLSVVTVVFKEGIDIYWARQQLGESLKEAQENIPTSAGTPELAPISTGLSEILQYTLEIEKGYEEDYNLADLRTFQDWIIAKQLMGTQGIAEVSPLGGYLKQYEIALDANKLRSLKISIGDVYKALTDNNENTGGSYIDKKPNAYFVRGLGLIKSLEDIENIVVKQQNNFPVLIKDIAKVQFGHATRYGAMTADGKGETAGAMVLMLKGENASEVTKRVKLKLIEIQKSLPKGIVIKPFIDREKLVNKTISTVRNNLMEGALIVVFVLVLLLGNLRAGLIVASVIPLALLFAIILMRLFGVSGNLMSLGAIDFGLVVDGAVIIVESIVHRILTSKSLKSKPVLSKEEMDDEVITASKKIRKSAAFGEFIILIVYIPILTLVGVEGKMFKPMAMTVAFAILGAFILSLTYVPMISALFLSKKTEHKRNFSDKMIDALKRLYLPILKKALGLKALVMSVTLVLFGLAFYIFSGMGGEFMPTLDEGDIAINAMIKPGSSLSQTIENTTKLEKIIKAFPEVDRVIGKIGSGEIPTDPMPIESTDLIVVLKPTKEWESTRTKAQLVSDMKKAMAVIPGIAFEFSQPVQMRFNELMTGVRTDVAIKLYGEDLDVLSLKAKEISSLISSIQGVADIKVEQQQGLPQIMVNYNRQNIAQYGLSIKTINQVLRASFAGEMAGVVFEGEKRFDLVMKLQKDQRRSIEDVKSLYVTAPNGLQVPLGQLAEVRFESGAMQISRDNGKRRTTIGLNVRDRDVESVIKDIQAKLDKALKLPPNYSLTYGGQFENLESAKARLMVAVPVALFLIFILLYFTFKSVIQSLLIFTAIPLSAIGGVIALWLRDMPFSISAGIGFIALFGVAVLNGIVLIGSFNQLKDEGFDNVRERILEGVSIRFRPVLLTASVASLGFLPMAISNSAGAEVQKPLASVVIGGLLSATILTLIVLPILYEWVSKTKASSRMKIPKNNGVLAFVFGMMSMTAFGQEKVVSLEGALNKLETSNLDLKALSAKLEALALEQEKAFDLDKTNFSVQMGEYASSSFDVGFSVSQKFEMPKVYRLKQELASVELQTGEMRIIQEKNILRNQVIKYWDQWHFLNARKKLVNKQLELMISLSRGTNLQYQTGEVNYLAKINADSFKEEYKTKVYQIEQDIESTKQMLALWIGENVLGEVNFEDYTTLKLENKNFEAENNLEIQAFDQAQKVVDAQIELEKTKLLPSFSLGYTNQSMIDQPLYNIGDRFSSVNIGVSIPLFNKSIKAGIAQGKSKKMEVESLQEAKIFKLKQRFKIELTNLKKAEKGLEYFQNTALNRAKELKHYAKRNYQEGEITQIEYLQYLKRALSIELDYIYQIKQYNQVIIHLENIKNKNND